MISRFGLIMKRSILFFPLLLILLGAISEKKPVNVFNENWAPSPANGSFKMENYITWGGSVIRGADGKYYMFASRWPKKLSMSAWVTNSEVVLAISDKPEGPYHFEKVVLPPRGKEYWDGMVTHNPTIRYHKGKYILFYTGENYSFDQPKDSVPTRALYEKAWNNKRVGVAVADSPYGPWKRMDSPVLQPRPGNWDGAIISNPAPVIHEDGSVLLIYKSAPVPYPERNMNRKMEFGVAKADHYLGEYRRVSSNNQISLSPITTDVEDPYVWYDGNKYHMLAKCMNEAITGERGAGFYSTSENGMAWTIAEIPNAYTKELELTDGRTVTMKKLERPQVLFEKGKPTHVFFACTTPENEIFNIARPLRK